MAKACASTTATTSTSSSTPAQGKDSALESKKTVSNSLIPAQMVDCMETPCAEEAAFLFAVKSPISNSFFIHVSVPHFPNLSFDSLLGCGSSHCFIDEHFACSNHFSIIPIAPIGLHLLDGSLAGTITSTSEISVKFPCGTFLKICFFTNQAGP